MTNLRRLVLDVLKPHNPTSIEISQKLSNIRGVHFVNTLLEEVDQDTESVRVTIEGSKLDFAVIKEIIEDCGGAVHSVDEVTVGRHSNTYYRKKNKKQQNNSKV